MQKIGNWGHVCLDDSFVIESSKELCLIAIQDLINLFEKLGFIINREKSVLVPVKKITFLGLELDSTKMMVNLTKEKKENL